MFFNFSIFVVQSLVMLRVEFANTSLIRLISDWVIDVNEDTSWRRVCWLEELDSTHWVESRVLKIIAHFFPEQSAVTTV